MGSKWLWIALLVGVSLVAAVVLGMFLGYWMGVEVGCETPSAQTDTGMLTMTDTLKAFGYKTVDEFAVDWALSEWTRQHLEVCPGERVPCLRIPATSGIGPFYFANPTNTWQDGWRSAPTEECRPGWEGSDECYQIGIPPNWHGSVDGFSVRPEQYVVSAAVPPTPTFAPTTVPPTVQPTWTSESWVRQHFYLGFDAEIAGPNAANCWLIVPAEGYSSFGITNPDGVWQDGWRLNDGAPRPGYTGQDEVRSGIPPAQTVVAEGATLCPPGE